jgi:hypothetical protein
MLSDFVIYFLSVIGVTLTFHSVMNKHKGYLMSKKLDRLFYCDLCTIFWFQMFFCVVLYFLTGIEWIPLMPFITTGFSARF